MLSPTRVLTLFTSQHRNLSAGRRLGIVALAAVMAATLAPLTLVGPAGAAAGDCTGEVFRDHNADGVRQVAGDPTGNGVDVYVTEPGEPGVIVTAYDDTGSVVGSTTTLADGTFDLSTSASLGTPIRVEFTWTEAWMTSGPHGPDNGSSVQFSTTGSCNLTFGVMNAAEYCEANPYLTVPCYRQGDYDAPGNVGTNDALVTIGYEWGQDTPDPAANQTNWKPTWQVDETGALAPPLMTADSLDVGTVWGETWNATDEVLFAAAYMKVAADFGPGGPGAIYAIPMDPDNGVPSGPVTQFADLDALGFDVCSDPHGPDLTDPAITVPTVTDATYGAVGKCGLGGLAIDDTDETMYTVNLTSREVVALDVATGAAMGSWGFLDPAAGLATPRCADPATDFRPFALEWHDGELYAGAICSAESTGVDSDLQAYVYQVDLAAGAFNLILDYQLQSESILWRAWETTLADTSTEASLTGPSWLNGNGWVVHPTPLLTDIGFYNRDLVLGFRDMMADKTGQMIAIPEFSAVQPAGLWVAPSTGDLACAAFTPNPGDPTTGSWNIEEGNRCGDRTGANVEGAAFKEIGTNDRVGLEFYQDGGGQNIGTVDAEIHLGAVASVPGLPLVQTTVNPSEHIGQVPRIVWSSGLGWNDSTEGSSLRGYLVYTGSGPTDISNFGKTSGLGDVEPLCGLAPLEIGNFVWYDADGDGIQSPSEAPVQGATVNLYDGAGNLLASTTTGPDGEYYFDVDPTTDHVIRMDHAPDFAAGGPLDRWTLTVDSADADDDADSDGVPGTDGFPEIAYSSGRAGANDHTLDFGYFQDDQIFDLALIKQLSDGTNLATVAPGDQVTFTITVTNQGALDATQIAVVDYLPTGLTLADEDWTDLGNGTAQLATPIAFLAAGDTTTIDITVTVDQDATGQLDNWAEISAHLDENGNPIDDIDSTPNTDQTDDNQPDGPGAVGDDEVGEDGKQGGDEDDHDVAGVTINPIFDLALIKQLSDGTNLATVAPGDQVTFTITVTNQGALDATQIAVVDYLPTGLTLADEDWTDLGNGTAQLATPIAFLAAGDTTTIDITVTVDQDATGQLDNWAEISAHLDENGNPIDDIDSTPNTDQTDDNQPDGPGAVGDDEVGEDGKQGGDEDDHDVAGVTINPIFDLALIKQLSDGTNLATVAPGDQVTFTITVTNQGALDATQIAVVDYLPTGLTLADEDWTDLGNGTAQLATPIAFLAAGDTTTIDITVTVDQDATGQLDNWAEISAHLDENGNPIDDIDSTPNTDQTDDNQPDGPGAVGDDEVGEDGKQGGDEDDHDVAGVTINPIFDLALIKQLSDGTNLATVAPGDQVTFTITVTNQGALDATQIAVVDYLPTGLTLADEDWTDLGNGTAQLATPIAFLAAGDTTTIDITVTVDQDATGQLDNWAEISAHLDENGNPIDDIDSTPNTDQTDDNQPDGPGAVGDDEVGEDGKQGGDEDDHDVAGVTINPIFDLALIKQLSDGTNLATVAPGDQVTFTITVTNQGALDATQIAVVDYLPTGLTLADEDWTDLGNGTAQLATPIAFLAAGDTTTIDITVTVDQDATGQLDNWAEISAHLDENGNPIDDIDSTPNTDQTDDNQPDGPGAVGDDEVGEDGKQGGDEDDHDVAGVTINPIFDLALIKQLSDGTNLATVAPGDQVTFTITVTNQGALDATQIAVVDYLPTGLTLADEDWTDLGNGTAQLATPIAFLAAGDTTTIDITVTVDQDATGQLDNWAEISAHLDENGNPIDDIDSTPNDTNDDTFIQDDSVTGNGRTGGDEDDHDRAQLDIEVVEVLDREIINPPDITPNVPPVDVEQSDLVRTGINSLELGLLGSFLIIAGLFLSLRFSERAGTRRGSRGSTKA